MPDNLTLTIKGDRVLKSKDGDKLGFRGVARRIVTTLVDEASENGLVIGIEGAWGSGKSSLLFLIEDELKNNSDKNRASIIHFQPWLIGNRDALIKNLFDELLRTINEIAANAGDPSGAQRAKAESAATALRTFVHGVSKFGSVVAFAGKISSIGLIEVTGDFLSALKDPTSINESNSDIYSMKEKLSESLRELSHKIIITIDDVDRLEPLEIIEIMRLVRSVADLPNVSYLLCYDSDIISHSIEKASDIKDGRAYLEKIVQLTVMVPIPEPLQLRRWFSDDLGQIATTKTEDELLRLNYVIEYEGGKQLRTPRAVVRTLDAIRFHLPLLQQENLDLADLVWIQIIKNNNQNLYRWIENYCAKSALFSLDIARMNDGEVEMECTALKAALNVEQLSDISYLYFFADQLPHADVHQAEHAHPIRVFQKQRQFKIDTSRQLKRLSSPDHYRLYFALSIPSFSITQDEISDAWTALNDSVKRTEDILLLFYNVLVAGSLTKADIFFDRLKENRNLSEIQRKNILIAISNIMDEMHGRKSFNIYWPNSIWDKSIQLVKALLEIPEFNDRKIIENIFREGKSIDWLTKLLRREIIIHGRFGDQRHFPGSWVLNEDELDVAIAIMLERYKSMSTSEFLKRISPINIIYAWQQSGDSSGSREFIDTAIEADENLLIFLRTTIVRKSSSELRVKNYISKDLISEITDIEIIIKRLNEIKKNPILSQEAIKIIDMLE